MSLCLLIISKTSYCFDVNSAVGYFHLVDMGSVVDISEVHSASILGFYLCGFSEILSIYRVILRRNNLEGRAKTGGPS
jgi:hypothetical protein